MAQTSSPETTAGDPLFFKDLARQANPAPAPKRGVIYARYSSEMQDTSDSIEVQIAECKKYAMANGILLVREPFIDKAETGTATENRKSYQGLLRIAQCSERDFDTVLTFHTSRWGRGIESEIDEYLLEKNGIKIIAVTQSFTADDAIESMFMKGIMRKIDAYYSMQASKYTHAYQSSNAQNGFKNGGAAPDGYAIEHVPTGKKDKAGEEKLKTRLIVDTKPGKFDITDAPRHKLIEFTFSNASQGRGIKWLSKTVYEHGWRSRYRPDRISNGTIRSWLTNPIYTGFMVWNRVRFFRRNGKRAYVHNPISKWICSPKPSHAPIVPKDLFESVAIKFFRRRSYKGRPPPAGPTTSLPVDRGCYLLSGLLHCALCKAMYVAAKNAHRGKKTHVYYVCNTKWRHGRQACHSRNINLAVAEGAVLETLLNRVLTEDEVKRFIDTFNLFVKGQKRDSQDELARLDQEKNRIELELSRLRVAILSGADPRTLAAELNTRQDLLDTLERERARLEKPTAGGMVTYDPKRLSAWITTLKDNFYAADFETRRELVRQFVERVDVDPNGAAQMTWNPAAMLGFNGGPRVPDAGAAMLVIQNHCGGVHRLNHPRSWNKIAVRFEKRTNRWPFGWDILRRCGTPATARLRTA
jgi:DNA invertase Pin-like site-specific DNA recombinase